MNSNRPKTIHLNPADNVVVAVEDLPAGEIIAPGRITCRQKISAGHKLAIEPMKIGQAVIKYGQVIGRAKTSIEPGDHVHVHNMAMAELSREYEYGAAAKPAEYFSDRQRATFEGFVRDSGTVGTRNYIGILATVSCSSSVAQFIADAVTPELLAGFPNVDGVVALGHENGCCHAPESKGLEILQRTLAGYTRNPNFGGVLLVGLGCEVNLVATLMQNMQLTADSLLSPFVIQESGGTRKTVEAGLKAIRKMLPVINKTLRQTVSAEHLTVGLECGGSDAYSGITANPALGAAVDLVVRNGGTAILSETPEIYGAEHLLVARAVSREVGEQLINHVRWWEEYTATHGAQINNNPTPGNKAGGLTTILEKSMGAVAKAGSTNLNAVYRYAEKVVEKGLVFMNSPGYDVVSITGKIAAGANLVCFTTGRGTVCGFKPVPTLKLASNSVMYNHLSEDMDINCGRILDGELTLAQMGEDIFKEILAVASGKQTKSEKLGFGGNEFVPWHIGAVL